jgi:hypothetical protein
MWSTCFIKISVLLFFRRLADGACPRGYRRAMWAAIIFVAIFTIITYAILVTSCTPTEAFWRHLDPNYNTSYHCINPNTQAWASKLMDVLSTLTSIYSLVLPAIVLLRLNINKRQKIGLGAIFSLAIW